MEKFTSDGLRKTWIKFYEDRGHVNCGAVSLVSDGSTGVLFNVAGMQPLMPYLLGEKHPKGTRLCNVQGCVRTNDIDSVGDASHVTFFEMMGSWSLGDYFKKERCQWSYELLTEVFKFDRDHLAATVFAGDENAPRDEEGAKYREESGFKKENIFYLPAEDNWWGLEYGPCGPDSEMFYVKDMPDCGPDCGPGCHCGKYTEVGNDVFMQYEKHRDGKLTPLAQKNVDTGWGLERILAFLNGFSDVYKVDLFADAIAYIEKTSGKTYDTDEKITKSMRVLADHVRTSVMLIGDEAKLLPANTGAGYVLRRLIRRAVRHARTLSMTKEDILNLAEIYITKVYKESYPLLTKNHDFIIEELGREISRFEETLENGIKEFKKILSDCKSKDVKTINGTSAFYLYDTFGFPVELTVELAEENGLTVDEAGFKKAYEEAQALSKANNNTGSVDISTTVYNELAADITTTFVGYDCLENNSIIKAIVNEKSEIVSELKNGSRGAVIVSETAFYATMGGQEGDTGVIKTSNGVFNVEETIKVTGGRVAHLGTVIEGSVSVDEEASMSVDSSKRNATCRNHSATHLLQSALRKVLGDKVEQKGSMQNPARTRFDFSYQQALTKEEIKKVESIVNDMIAEDIAVTTDVMSIDEAKATGAMALFGEKYGDTVRVVSMGDFSKELCGGTHVSHTGDIGTFKIVSESGVAAGVRRIEAITGTNVITYYETVEKITEEASKIAKCNINELTDKVKALIADNKALAAELEAMKAKIAKEALSDTDADAVEINGVKLIATSVADVDMNNLRDLGDQLRDKNPCSVIVLASAQGGKVNLIAMATDDAMKKGAHAGNLIKGIAALVGGGGGGRPNMAQAGGKNPDGIDACLNEAKKVLESQLA